MESACARSARNQEAQAGSCCCGWRKGSAQKRWLKAYGRRAAPSRGESSGWSGFIRGSRARGPADDVVRAARGVRRVARSVRRAPQTERRGLADIVVDVVRRPSGARGCHQIGAAVHQRYRARYVWPRCSPAGGGHSDLYMHMYKRETMILREDFRIRGTEARGDAGGGARRGGQSRPQPACLRVAPLGVGYAEGSGDDEARSGRWSRAGHGQASSSAGTAP